MILRKSRRIKELIEDVANPTSANHKKTRRRASTQTSSLKCKTRKKYTAKSRHTSKESIDFVMGEMVNYLSSNDITMASITDFKRYYDKKFATNLSINNCIYSLNKENEKGNDKIIFYEEQIVSLFENVEDTILMGALLRMREVLGLANIIEVINELRYANKLHFVTVEFVAGKLRKMYCGPQRTKLMLALVSIVNPQSEVKKNIIKRGRKKMAVQRANEIQFLQNAASVKLVWKKEMKELQKQYSAITKDDINYLKTFNFDGDLENTLNSILSNQATEITKLLKVITFDKDFKKESVTLFEMKKDYKIQYIFQLMENYKTNDVHKYI